MFYVSFIPFSVLIAELAWLLAVHWWSHDALGCVCRPIRGRASDWELSLGHLHTNERWKLSEEFNSCKQVRSQSFCFPRLLLFDELCVRLKT